MKESDIIGWIFLDKPLGISSNRALQQVRKIFHYCKAGYVGTLDPLASGFLPIALGKSTKTIKTSLKFYANPTLTNFLS